MINPFKVSVNASLLTKVADFNLKVDEQEDRLAEECLCHALQRNRLLTGNGIVFNGQKSFAGFMNFKSELELLIKSK